MSAEAPLSEQIRLLAKSMSDCGLTGGGTGNISACADGGGLLVSPAGTCFGRSDTARLNRIDEARRLVGGENLTRGLPLHTVFCDTRSSAGAVVHLHACHSAALSMSPDADPDCFLPTLTPYGIMKPGKVRMLPFLLPGGLEKGRVVHGLAGSRAAVMLASHGPVAAGKDVTAACHTLEELEDTSRLTLLTGSLNPLILTRDQIADLVQKFYVEWCA